jgi:hypothetical protein
MMLSRELLVDVRDGMVVLEVGRLLRPQVVLKFRPVDVDQLCGLLRDMAEVAKEQTEKAAKHRELLELAAANAGTLPA